MQPNIPADWYDRRDELCGGMIFLTREGDYVQLDRDVPGDATRWYVADWSNGTWFFEDSTIEPGDLVQRVDAPTLIGGAA